MQHLADVLTVRPTPTDEETAAIVAAVDGLWPRVVIVEGEQPHRGVWKFSGRWWSQPIPLRRARPWV